MRLAPLQHLLSASLFAGCLMFASEAVPAPAVDPQVDSASPTDSEQARALLAQRMPNAQLLDSGGRLRRVWGARLSGGATPAESAERFMRTWSMLWDVPFSQLVPIGPFENGEHLLPLMPDATGSPDFTAVYWSQQVAGIPVYRSHGWVLVGNESGHPAVLAGGTLRTLGDFERSLEGRPLDAASLPALVQRSPALDHFREPPQIETPRFVVWAGVDDDLPKPRLAVEFKATAGAFHDPDRLQSLRFVIDADTGEVLHLENLVMHVDATVQVQAAVTPGAAASACTAPATRGLPYLKVDVDGQTLHTDADGRLALDVGPGSSVTVAPVLDGLYFQVLDWLIALQQVAPQSVGDGESAQFLFESDVSEATRSQVDTYTSANEVRDMVLRCSPAFPDIGAQRSMRIYNNYGSSCNAMYSGGTMNFYRSGKGCNNTGFRSVVAHEYGHHVVDRGGSGQGAYGEGFGDAMSALLLDDPVTGPGFMTCSTGIRSAQNTCIGRRTDSSCGSEIHVWGQVLSGCVWDLRNAMAPVHPQDYLDRVGRLVVNEVPLHAGQSDIWTDITVDYITLDDAPSNGGDNDLANGSPNLDRIDGAFALHGLGAPLIEVVPGTHPSIIDPAGRTVMTVRMTSGKSVVAAGSEALRIRQKGQPAFDRVALRPTGSGVYEAVFPPAPQGCMLEYYFEASSSSGTVITAPAAGASSAYSVLCSTFDQLTVVGWGAGTSYNGTPSSNGVSSSTPDYNQAVPRIMPGVRQVDAGAFFSVAVCIDGTAIAWGSPYLGVLNVPTTLTDAVQVAAGNYHGLALRQTGSVVGWGSNSYGQRSIPVGLQGVRQIGAGGSHSMALLSSGEVVCWGAGRTNTGSFGQFGQSIVPAGLGGVRHVAGGDEHTVACRVDGSVICWGNASSGQTSVPPALGPASQVAAGNRFSAALVDDGSAVMWGSSILAGNVYRPPVEFGPLESIVAGAQHMVGLCSGGRAVAWGGNANGESTVPLQLGRVKCVAAGGQHSLAVAGCTADIDGNGMIDFGDLVIILLEQGAGPESVADLDRNGVVDLGDAAIQMLEHGPCI